MSVANSMFEWLENHIAKPYGNFINGEWVDSTSNRTFPIYNSAKQSQVLGYFQESNEKDIDHAVNVAHNAFANWSKVPGPDRASILYRFANLLEMNMDELAFMLSAEHGKPLGESRGEILRAAKETRFCAGEASRVEGITYPGERQNVWSSTIREPIGVIAAIAPWNFPIVTPVRKIAPALAYGCTVVYKPASATPWTSTKIMELLYEAGVPKGVVNLVVGSGSKVGNPLVSHPLVRGISFTGSTNMGVSINEIAAKKMAKTQLELGGKNPAVILDYDDVEEVARQIVSAAFTCSGQRCTSISRVIVLKDKKEEVIDALIHEIQKITIGPAWEQGVTMGPLVNKDHLETVQNYIRLGIEDGARLRYGGQVLKEGHYSDGAYMVPALFDEVTSNMRIAKEEIFGPVLSVLAAENVEEAILFANEVEYGLASALFTKDISRAFQFANLVQSGMVHINHGTASAAHVPFGGKKNSGFGAFSIGASNIEFYTDLKAIYIQY